jgi:hypothetical protein
MKREKGQLPPDSIFTSDDATDSEGKVEALRCESVYSRPTEAWNSGGAHHGQHHDTIIPPKRTNHARANKDAERNTNE